MKRGLKEKTYICKKCGKVKRLDEKRIESFLPLPNMLIRA